MTDQQKLIDALVNAGVILGEHIEPGHARDPELTITRLLEVLDDRDLAAAIERLKSGFGLKVVK
jgi:hypothetical protein